MQDLHELGFGSVGSIAADVQQERKVVQFWSAPVRIDIMTSIKWYRRSSRGRAGTRAESSLCIDWLF